MAIFLTSGAFMGDAIIGRKVLIMGWHCFKLNYKKSVALIRQTRKK